MIGKVGVFPDSDNTKAILELPIPETSKDFQRFFGLFSSVRKFTPSFGTVAEPLHNLAKPAAHFN